MGSQFLTIFRIFIREPGLFVWSLLFPCILGTMFSVMFSGLDEMGNMVSEIPVVVVADEGWGSEEAQAFKDVLHELSSPSSHEGASGEDRPLLKITELPTLLDARAAVDGDDAVAAIAFEAEKPHLYMRVADSTDAIGIDLINETIIKTVVDSALQVNAATESGVSDLRERISYLLAQVTSGDARAAEELAGLENSSVTIAENVEQVASEGHVREISLTRNSPSETLRFYYGLFGIAVLMCASIGCVALSRVRPGGSLVGMRVSVGGVGRVKLAIVALLSAWLISFACLIVAYVFISLVLRVDLGSQPAAFLAALLAGAALATALGGVIGAIPCIPEGARAGIIVAIACIGALFAGLYGTPDMQFADMVSRAAPWVDYINPAKTIADALFALYNYDMLLPYWQSMAALGVFTLVCAGLIAVLLRRSRLAHL